MADDTGFLSRWSRRKVQVARGDEVAAVQETTPATTPAPPQPPDAATARAEAAADGSRLGPADAPAESGSSDARPAPPPPTMDEARALTPEADFRRFVARDVDPAVRNTALKALFRDPHFNVMDGLDIYIDDYSIPDPLPAGMLRRMTQSVALGLFKDDPADKAVPGNAASPGAAEAASEEGPERATGNTAEAPDDASTETSSAAVNEPVSDTGAGQEGPPEATEATATDPSTASAPTPPTPAHEDTDLRLQPHDAAGHAGDRKGAASQSGRER